MGNADELGVSPDLSGIMLIRVWCHCENGDVRVIARFLGWSSVETRVADCEYAMGVDDILEVIRQWVIRLAEAKLAQ
ncbi:hypothetical protein [Nocardia amikacinitolerans]|uniref:hypothetical protein n=1 Tax=Nocardia amikacinitolerans TaxID=756689 RepID=UPI0012EDF7AF|nr:hypothetical protein [Nocardia amikacinitolerans]